MMHRLNRSTSTPIDEISRATIDSVRLSTRGSLPLLNFPIERFSNSTTDIDIDALDAEFERLSQDFKDRMALLRKEPDNQQLRQTLISTSKSLLRMKAWTSLIQTTDGLALIQQNLAEQREKDIQQRKYEIDQILKISKAQSAIDLCFLMDCTGSMRKYVDATKTQIRQLTQTIVQFYGIKPRLAFVGYRDINENLDQLDFTDDENQFQAFLNQIQANGGDDTCEDVFGGLEVLGKLNWSSPNRVLVHICDAPCHGRQYHDFQGTDNDNYLTGDPKHRDITKLIFDIKRLGVIYCKIQLNETTKKMFDEFEFIFGTIADIYVRDPNDLMQRVIEKTSAIIQSHIQSTISTFHDAERPRISYTIFTKEPDWQQLESIPVQITEIIPVTELDELFYPLGIHRSSGAMKIATNPFAKGSLRYAFYGQFSTENSSFDDVVYKELANVYSEMNAFMIYREHLEIQAIAQFLAEQFNAEQKRLFRNSIPIIYADANLVQQVNNPSKIYQVERRMQHEWRKWNNNSGGVSLNEYSTILQAFSHWTYHITKARLMVVDLQGVKVERAYLLTDPALHCDDLLRFRRTRTNLGVKGMQQFFRTHICSEICTKFNLPLMNDWSSDSTSNVSTLDTKLSDVSDLITTAHNDFESIDRNQIEMIEVFELC